MDDQATFRVKLESFRDQWFPERQVFLRSEGRVNFVTFSSNLQLGIAAGALAALVWTGMTSVSWFTRDAALEEREVRIRQLADEKDQLDDELGMLQGEILERTEKLEKRQRLLEQLNGVEPVPVPAVLNDADENPATRDNDADSQNSSPISLLSSPANAAETETWTQMDAIQEGLAQIDARHELLGQKMLANIELEISSINQTLAAASLDADAAIERGNAANPAFRGQGGPFEPVVSPEIGQLDLESGILANFVKERERLHLATLALDSLPVLEPAADFYVSSKYGTRRDPMTKRWASHKALDLAGWPGTAIQASGAGKVVRAGWWGPYGNMVEIDHGNGFRTRYGHMRRLHVKKGDIVEPGQKLGEMGKTGRATSSHLHYEVWRDSEVIDPMPYLKASENVLKIKQRTATKADNQAG